MNDSTNLPKEDKQKQYPESIAEESAPQPTDKPKRVPPERPIHSNELPPITAVYAGPAYFSGPKERAEIMENTLAYPNMPPPEMNVQAPIAMMTVYAGPDAMNGINSRPFASAPNMNVIPPSAEPDLTECRICSCCGAKTPKKGKFCIECGVTLA